jgi:hypothetical protein
VSKLSHKSNTNRSFSVWWSNLKPESFSLEQKQQQFFSFHYIDKKKYIFSLRLVPTQDVHKISYLYEHFVLPYTMFQLKVYFTDHMYFSIQMTPVLVTVSQKFDD